MSYSTSNEPTLELESELFEQGVHLVAGVDEVGRGALAGPVTVGVAVIDAGVGTFPQGLRDSKLISASRRKKLEIPVQEWLIDYAVGSAQAQEIDDIGIIAALHLAWTRAMKKLTVAPDHIILDGKHNWINSVDPHQSIPTTTRIKADRDCAVVAAASVLAKVWRDNHMKDLSQQFPIYEWDSNAGYGSARHMDAIAKCGPTQFHRQSWSLPEYQG